MAHNTDSLDKQNTEIKPRITDSYKKYIDDLDVKYGHPNSEALKFDDLFIYPELKPRKKDLDSFPPNIASEKLLDYSDKTIVFGDEQSGKTTLIKKLFSIAFSRGDLPILIDAASIKSFDFDRCLSKLISSTYENISREYFFNHPNRICFIDNISTLSLNKRAKDNLLSKINFYFDKVILLADDIFGFVTSDYAELDNYQELEILPFSHVSRSKLIEKWVLLELPEDTDDQTIWHRIDSLKVHVNGLVRKNIVPAKPIYVLMFLASFEATRTQKFELTSYGHCYQYLIYQELDKVKVKPDELETYINILSELGGTLLNSQGTTLNETQLDIFFEEYSNKYLPVNRAKIVKDLIESNILIDSETGLMFRYRYSFYFFAAKNLADCLHQRNNSQDKIQNLVDRIHLEEAGNIILFLTHHSKDPWILDQILYSVMELFTGEEELTLQENSLSFLQGFVAKIPDLVIENRDAKQERLNNDIEKDAIESRDSEEKLDNESVDEDGVELINNIKRVFRATEVCGQILRNRLGSLDRDSLESIYEESLSASLRLVSIILKLSDYAREESIRRIEYFLENNPEFSDDKIVNSVESFFLGLNYDIILGMLNRIAHSLGSEKGREIYTKVTKYLDTPALDLIQEIIELQFEKNLDIRKIENLYKKFAKNPICRRLLKQIVIQYCYLHDINYRERQKLASRLNISLQTQHSMMLASHKNV